MINELTENIVVVFGNPDSGFVFQDVLGGFSYLDQPDESDLSGMDADSDLDLAVADFVGRSVAVFFQLSPGSFGAAPVILSFPTGPTALRVVDLDGDGLVETVVATPPTLT